MLISQNILLNMLTFNFVICILLCCCNLTSLFIFWN